MSPIIEASATTIEIILIIKEPNADVCAIYRYIRNFMADEPIAHTDRMLV
jgi:hypothetical protein